jgi:hypothetical protein
VAVLNGALPEALPGSGPERDQTSLFDSLLAAVMQPPDPLRRRLLIAISDGIDASSAIPYPVRSAVLDRSDVVIDLVAVAEWRWVYQYRVPPWTFFRTPTRKYVFRVSETGLPWVLFDVVERTGGQLFDVKPADDFIPTLMQSIDEFRQRYLLRYRPTDVSPTGWHELTVTVPGKKHEVRHRRGYWRGENKPPEK